jgi:hypothetical protein
MKWGRTHHQRSRDLNSGRHRDPGTRWSSKKDDPYFFNPINEGLQEIEEEQAALEALFTIDDLPPLDPFDECLYDLMDPSSAIPSRLRMS